jgi:CAAX protease family protein
MATVVRHERKSTTGRGGLKEVLQDHPLTSFFVFAYAFSWITLIPYIGANWNGSSTTGISQLSYLIHCFGPAVAAVTMVAVIDGKTGLLRLWHRIIQWRINWKWYLMVLVGFPAVFVAAVLIQPAGLAAFKGFTAHAMVAFPIVLVILAFTTGGFGEEIGWRGFALPRMLPRYGPLWGSLLLGVLWGVWHVADFLTPSKGGGAGTGLAQFLTNFPLFVLQVVALSVIFTWLFNHTKGSVLFAAFSHAAIDAVDGAWISAVPAVFAIGMTTETLAGVIGFVVPALLILILTRGRLGYRPENSLEAKV